MNMNMNNKESIEKCSKPSALSLWQERERAQQNGVSVPSSAWKSKPPVSVFTPPDEKLLTATLLKRSHVGTRSSPIAAVLEANTKCHTAPAMPQFVTLQKKTVKQLQHQDSALGSRSLSLPFTEEREETKKCQEETQNEVIAQVPELKPFDDTALELAPFMIPLPESPLESPLVPHKEPNETATLPVDGNDTETLSFTPLVLDLESTSTSLEEMLPVLPLPAVEEATLPIQVPIRPMVRILTFDEKKALMKSLSNVKLQKVESTLNENQMEVKPVSVNITATLQATSSMAVMPLEEKNLSSQTEQNVDENPNTSNSTSNISSSTNSTSTTISRFSIGRMVQNLLPKAPTSTNTLPPRPSSGTGTLPRGFSLRRMTRIDPDKVNHSTIAAATPHTSLMRRRTLTSSQNNASQTCTPVRKEMSAPTISAIPQYWYETVHDATLLDTLSKQERTRQEKIYEFIRTEFEFIVDLKHTINFYERPLLRRGCLNPYERDRMFANVGDLLSVHEDFWRALVARQQTSVVVTGIAEIIQLFFNQLAPIYLIYCPNLYAARLMLSSKQRQADAAFTETLLAAATHERRLDLWSYLDAPRRHVTKYPLLLTNLLASTDASSEEYKVLKEAMQFMDKALKEVEQVSLRESKESGVNDAGSAGAMPALPVLKRESSSATVVTEQLPVSSSLQRSNSISSRMTTPSLHSVMTSNTVASTAASILSPTQRVTYDQSLLWLQKITQSTASMPKQVTELVASSSQLIHQGYLESQGSGKGLHLFLTDVCLVAFQVRSKPNEPVVIKALYKKPIAPLDGLYIQDIKDGTPLTNSSLLSKITTTANVYQNCLEIKEQSADGRILQKWILRASNPAAKQGWIHAVRLVLGGLDQDEMEEARKWVTVKQDETLRPR